jgi:hypothetical protein
MWTSLICAKVNNHARSFQVNAHQLHQPVTILLYHDAVMSHSKALLDIPSLLFLDSDRDTSHSKIASALHPSSNIVVNFNLCEGCATELSSVCLPCNNNSGKTVRNGGMACVLQCSYVLQVSMNAFNYVQRSRHVSAVKTRTSN